MTTTEPLDSRETSRAWVFCYYRDQTTIEAALAAAGFSAIRWVQPELSPEGAAQYGAETFAGYLRQPHAVLLECVKQE
jgi:toxoflavin synthase